MLLDAVKAALGTEGPDVNSLRSLHVRCLQLLDRLLTRPQGYASSPSRDSSQSQGSATVSLHQWCKQQSWLFRSQCLQENDTC